MSNQPFLSTAEVAERLQVTPTTVARWVKEGYLAAARTPGIRGRFRFDPSEVERMASTLTPREATA